MNEKTSLERIEFEEFNIRRAWDDETERWWFAVVDVVKALTDSKKPRDYWYRMKKRVGENEGIELSTDCRQFRMMAANGRSQSGRCGTRRRARCLYAGGTSPLGGTALRSSVNFEENQ